MSSMAAALKPRSVLIATDFSKASNKALRHALAIARFCESKFCLAHVVSSLGLTLAGPDAIAACEQAASRDAAELKHYLIRTGTLAGIQHKFIIRRGELWPELREIIREEHVDLIVIGTHGRHGTSKLFFGSAAEQIFLNADCPVLIVGPKSYERPWIGASSSCRTFLFATDLGEAAVQIMRQGVAVANHCGAKLDFLPTVPAIAPLRCRHVDGRLRRLEDDAYLNAPRAMANLANRSTLNLRPAFHIEFEWKKIVSAWILETAKRLGADLIIMSSKYSPHAALMSHLGSTTVYDVACQASSPVLVVSGPSEQACIPSTAAELKNSPCSEADLIGITGSE